MTILDRLEAEIKRQDQKIWDANGERWGVRYWYSQEAADLRELLEDTVKALRAPVIKAYPIIHRYENLETGEVRST